MTGLRFGKPQRADLSRPGSTLTGGSNVRGREHVIAAIDVSARFQPQGIRPGIDGGDDHVQPRRFFPSLTKEASDGNADDNYVYGARLSLG